MEGGRGDVRGEMVQNAINLEEGLKEAVRDFKAGPKDVPSYFAEGSKDSADLWGGGEAGAKLAGGPEASSK
eukprot:2394266-Rhodomonas_salina.1